MRDELWQLRDPRTGPENEVLTFPLNAAAVSDINTAAGGFFSIGGTLTSQDGDDLMLGFSSSFGVRRLVVEIRNEPPVANANGPYTGDEGSPVAFDGTGSSDPDLDALTFNWSFGDPNGPTPGTGPGPSHTYADNGPFVVALTVSDGVLADVNATTATIANVPLTVAPITGAPLAPVAAGTSVTVSADFTDPGTLDTHSATIDWGDGT